MKKKLIILISATFITLNDFAQVNFNNLPVSVSYFGENGIHPGLKFGTQYRFFSKEKSKTYRLKYRANKYKSKIKLRELYVDYNLGFYSFPNNHTGYFTNVGVSYLRTKTNRKNRQIGCSLEVGYLRRGYKFKTYELNNGEIKTYNQTGNNAFQVGLGISFGREFDFKGNTVRLYFKPIAQFITYTYKFRPNASLETGLVFNINR